MKPYYHYWGKFSKPLQLDYCQGVLSDEEMLAKYDSINSLDDLYRTARKNQWQRLASPHAFVPYHLLPYHCLDVAAVGMLFIQYDIFGCRTLLQKTFGEDEWEQYAQLFVFALVLHDLGKFGRNFQSLKPRDYLGLVPNSELFLAQTSVRHDSLGYVLVKELFAADGEATALLNLDRRQRGRLSQFLEITTGHHGKPPNTLDGSNPISWSRYFLNEDRVAAYEFIKDLQFLLPAMLPASLGDTDTRTAIKQLSWQLSGICILVDWLGSDQDVFAYRDKPLELKEYWQEIALPNAQKVLEKHQLKRQITVEPFNSVQGLFSYIQKSTPLQKHCAETLLLPGPQLFILEDIAGAGKTEAAMILAQRCLAAGKGKGVYVALPSMATSNAMFSRMEQHYRKLFTQDSKPSLVLAHGARHLSSLFQEIVAVSRQSSDLAYGSEQNDKELLADLSASAWCNLWHVDNRKKSLLADFGVGTIDQALMGVLPVRHQALKLLGLASKILIIDEVHCFSTYESKIIETLIRFHASQGGTCILLSATMPQNLRTRLSTAFYKGLAAPGIPLESEPTFPWFTGLAADNKLEAPVAARKSVSREIKVEYQQQFESLWNVVLNTLAAGKCVVWVKNTVDEAIELFEFAHKQLSKNDKSVVLFHSRFCMQNRLDKEAAVLAAFGCQSTSKDRRGKLLVASPVVDMSLDVDFDVMISDIAPIDVLIQRSGRLARHSRDELGNPLIGRDQRGMATLYLYGPEFTASPDKDWLNRHSSGSQVIYGSTAHVWLTANKLIETKKIVMPGMARELLNAVYADDVESQIPDALQKNHQDYIGEKMAEADLSAFNQLDLSQGYSMDSSNHWYEETDISTRLADDTENFVLLVLHDDSLKLYAHNERHPVDMSTVKLRGTIAKADSPALVNYAARVDALEQDFPPLRFYKKLLLIETSGQLITTSLDKNGKIVQLLYSAEMGLTKLRREDD